jgi:predicted transcriptional regulator
MTRNEKARSLIGQFLSHIISERGVVIEEITRQTGMSKTIIYNILHGRNYTVDSLLNLLVHKGDAYLTSMPG